MNGNNITEIKKLLDRYYNGETTEAEEKQLACYFAGEDVADELFAEKEIFLQLMNAAEPQIPMGLEARLEGAIDSWEAAERKAAENRRRIRPMSIRAIVSIAASLILVVALGVFFAKSNIPTADLHAESNVTPEEAYQQTEKALRIFANALDKSMDGMETVNETSEKIQRQVNSSLEQINNI